MQLKNCSNSAKDKYVFLQINDIEFVTGLAKSLSITWQMYFLKCLIL